MAESTRVSTQEFYQAQLKTNEAISEVKQLVLTLTGKVDVAINDISTNKKDIGELENKVDRITAKQAYWAGFFGAVGMILGGLLDKIFPGLK